MKRFLALTLAVAIAGCGGGYDDIDAMRDANAGMGSTPSSPSVPSTPSNPDARSLWEYNQVGDSRLAKINSLNTVPTSNELNNALMMVQIHNFIDSSGEAADYLTITVLFADTKCVSSCQMRLKRDGSTSAVYQVRESVNGVFSDRSFATGDMDKLIKAIKMSGEASISVPLIGVPNAEFEFDFSGYDSKYMDAKR